MKQIGAAFENFAFKAFDFSGRATLLEYWVVMPLIWSLIAFLFYGDVIELWGMLSNRQVPPLNPFYWDGVLVFLLTLIPRTSLTVRRLHDSGKNGKWVKLPLITVTSGIMLTLGVLSALATSSEMGTAGTVTIGMFGIIMSIALGSMGQTWDMIFGAVAILNALGLDAIFAMLAEMTAPVEKLSLRQGVDNVIKGMDDDPMGGGTIMLVLLGMIAAPFVTAFLHLFFMMSPTKPDHDLDSSAPMTGASLRKQGVTSDNPFAGYKHLYEKTAEQKAAARAAAQAEIKSLYQQRVLGANTQNP